MPQISSHPHSPCAAPPPPPATRASHAFSGLPSPFNLLRPRDTPAIDLLVDVGVCCLPMRPAPMGLAACLLASVSLGQLARSPRALLYAPVSVPSFSPSPRLRRRFAPLSLSPLSHLGGQHANIFPPCHSVVSHDVPSAASRPPPPPFATCVHSQAFILRPPSSLPSSPSPRSSPPHLL